MSDFNYSVHGFAKKIEEASSFNEWVGWFLLLLLLTSGIAVSALYGVEDKAIYVTMAVLAVVAFYSSFRDVSSLNKEIKTASRQMQQLVEDDDIEYFLERTEKANDHSYFRYYPCYRPLIGQLPCLLSLRL